MNTINQSMPACLKDSRWFLVGKTTVAIVLGVAELLRPLIGAINQRVPATTNSEIPPFYFLTNKVVRLE